LPPLAEKHAEDIRRQRIRQDYLSKLLLGRELSTKEILEFLVAEKGMASGEAAGGTSGSSLSGWRMNVEKAATCFSFRGRRYLEEFNSNTRATIRRRAVRGALECRNLPRPNKGTCPAPT
jgi:hypothetical protein